MTETAVKTQKQELVKVKNLVKHFPVEGSDDVVRAVDDVSFDILSGETLGLGRRIGLRKINRRALYFAALRTDERGSFV